MIEQNISSSKELDPRVLKITRLYWLRDDENGMLKTLNTVNNNVSGEDYQTELNISHVTPEVVSAALGEYGWDVEVNYNDFSDIEYFEAEGVTVDKRGYPEDGDAREVGWDEIRGTEGFVREAYTFDYSTPVWNADEGRWVIHRVTDQSMTRVLEALIPETVPTSYELNSR